MEPPTPRRVLWKMTFKALKRLQRILCCFLRPPILTHPEGRPPPVGGDNKVCEVWLLVVPAAAAYKYYLSSVSRQSWIAFHHWQWPHKFGLRLMIRLMVHPKQAQDPFSPLSRWLLLINCRQFGVKGMSCTLNEEGFLYHVGSNEHAWAT